MRLKFWNKKNDPNYRMMELEAENNRVKDELIENLRDQIVDLRLQLERYTAKVYTNEQDVGSNMIDSRNAINEPHGRPVIRTMSEAAKYLEKRSLNATSLKELPNEKS